MVDGNFLIFWLPCGNGVFFVATWQDRALHYWCPFFLKLGDATIVIGQAT
jgi:hypothetical protein